MGDALHTLEASVWAASIGLWPNHRIAEALRISPAKAKEIKSGRRSVYRPAIDAMHSNMCLFVRDHVPPGLIAELDGYNSRGIPTGSSSEFYSWCVDRFHNRPGVKFNDRMRNAILFEATRLNDYGELVHPDAAFFNAFRMGRMDVDRLRIGIGGVHAEYHLERARLKSRYLAQIGRGDLDNSGARKKNTLSAAYDKALRMKTGEPGHYQAVADYAALLEAYRYVFEHTYGNHSQFVHNLLLASVDRASDRQASKALRRVGSGFRRTHHSVT